MKSRIFCLLLTIVLYPATLPAAPLHAFSVYSSIPGSTESETLQHMGVITLQKEKAAADGGNKIHLRGVPDSSDLRYKEKEVATKKELTKKMPKRIILKEKLKRAVLGAPPKTKHFWSKKSDKTEEKTCSSPLRFPSHTNFSELSHTKVTLTSKIDGEHILTEGNTNSYHQGKLELILAHQMIMLAELFLQPQARASASKEAIDMHKKAADQKEKSSNTYTETIEVGKKPSEITTAKHETQGIELLISSIANTLSEANFLDPIFEINCECKIELLTTEQYDNYAITIEYPDSTTLLLIPTSLDNHQLSPEDQFYLSGDSDSSSETDSSQLQGEATGYSLQPTHGDSLAGEQFDHLEPLLENAPEASESEEEPRYQTVGPGREWGELTDDGKRRITTYNKELRQTSSRHELCRSTSCKEEANVDQTDRRDRDPDPDPDSNSDGVSNSPIYDFIHASSYASNGRGSSNTSSSKKSSNNGKKKSSSVYPTQTLKQSSLNYTIEFFAHAAKQHLLVNALQSK